MPHRNDLSTIKPFGGSLDTNDGGKKYAKQTDFSIIKVAVCNSSSQDKGLGKINACVAVTN